MLLVTCDYDVSSPAALVDLGGCGDLKGIVRKGRTLHVGAMSTHAEVAASAIVR